MNQTREDRDGVDDAERTVGFGMPADDELRAALAALRADGPRRLPEGELVAKGGMGVVCAVEDPLLQRLQAEKSLSARAESEPALQTALLREARLMGALEHPAIVPVHEVALNAQGALCFTMKLVQGRSLAEILRELPADAPHGRDRLLDLVDVVVKVCDALSYAHSRGVVHCDVKASNVMVGEHGQVYLMDWGVARVVGEGEALPVALRAQAPGIAETVTAISGSPAYASPEQARGETWRFGPQTDVFLVGALIYEILTRCPVHNAVSHVAALARAVRDDVPPPSSVVSHGGIPVELERIAMKALAFEQEDRHASVEVLREDLVRFARGGVEFPRRDYAAGEVIVREGEPGDAAYLIVSGRCEVSVTTAAGEQLLRTIGPGDPFGETSLLSPGPRTATVTAVAATTVEVVGRARFEEAVAAMPAWMCRFVFALADRFRERETGNGAAARDAPGAPGHQ